MGEGRLRINVGNHEGDEGDVWEGAVGATVDQCREMQSMGEIYRGGSKWRNVKNEGMYGG